VSEAKLGTFVLEHVLPYELDVHVSLLFTDTDLRCTPVIPRGGCSSGRAGGSVEPRVGR
jgi:hypothetical protein